MHVSLVAMNLVNFQISQAVASDSIFQFISCFVERLVYGIPWSTVSTRVTLNMCFADIVYVKENICQN